MIARMTQLAATSVALVLLVAALWGWGQAGWLAESAGKPAVALWAVRSGAVAAAAGAQVLLLTFAVGAIYSARQTVLDETLRLVSGLVCTIALISAIALMLAGR